MRQEIWMFIPYNTNYMVSNFGRVKSLNYNHYQGKEHILKQAKTRIGYLQVGLYKNGKRRNFLVHRLVWEAFNGPIPEGMQINHLNEEKTDNRLENLSLMTAKENHNWGTINARISKSHNKIINQYTIDGIHIHTWFSMLAIQNELGYSQGNISLCCSGKRKTAYGYIWKYAE